MPYVQHSGAMAVIEPYTLVHPAMQEGGGEKVTAPGSRREENGHIQGFQLVWKTPGDVDLFQLIGVGDLCGEQKLARSSQKPGKRRGQCGRG